MDKSIIILLFILIILLALCIYFVKYIHKSKFNSAAAGQNRHGGNYKKSNNILNSAATGQNRHGGRVQVNRLNPLNPTVHTHKLTYSLFGDDGLDYSILKKMLNVWFVEVPNNVPYADLTWGVIDIKNHNLYPKDFYFQKANLKSIFNASDTNKFTQKDLLLHSIHHHNKNLLPFIPKSQLLKDVHSTNNQILIVKVGTAYAQKGIQIVTTDRELHEAKKKFNPHSTIVSSYIRNPLLWKGKKFHLRPYILVYYDDNRIFSFVHNVYRVFTARKEYKQSDWLNTDIHITGADPNDRTLDDRIEWPNDFDLSEDLLVTCNQSLDLCVSEICKLIESISPKPYPESNSAFEIFGPDIIIDDTGRAWLLEINKKCGFGIVGEKDTWGVFNKKRSQDFFSWVLDTIIFKHFKYN